MATQEGEPGDPTSEGRHRFVRRALLRLSLWSLPVLVLALISTETRRVEQQALLLQVGSLLVDGQWDAARHLLAQGAVDDADDAAVSTLQAALHGEPVEPSSVTPGPAAADPGGTQLPLPLMVRTAFERGELEQAKHLTLLAEALGRPAVDAVQMALAIETGQMIEPQALEAPQARAPNASRLLDRLQGFARQSPELGGQVLRDRQGEPIATFDGRELRLLEGIRGEWVPRAVEAAMAAHPEVGSLRSSLDLELSAAAFRAFGRYNRGSIVIVDPRSGEVLAAVSDRRTYRQGGTPAFEQFREPASISKVITAAATLRAGLDPDTLLADMECRGHQSYDGERLYCPHIAGPLRGLDRAMAVSCNVAFANLAVRVGRRAVLDELRSFGFDDDRWPFAGARILQTRGDQRQLADLSIGLDDTEITPLHGALMAAVIANDGRMPRPRLLVSQDGRLGLHPRPLQTPSDRRVLERHQVQPILESMVAVARRGTARNMAPIDFPVAMKTGTASHPRYGFHVNYIGLGPLPEAELAFCVRITDQPTSRKVRAAAREVTSRLLRSLGRIGERRGWGSLEDGEPRRALASPDPAGSWAPGPARRHGAAQTSRSARR